MPCCGIDCLAARRPQGRFSSAILLVFLAIAVGTPPCGAQNNSLLNGKERTEITDLFEAGKYAELSRQLIKLHQRVPKVAPRSVVTRIINYGGWGATRRKNQAKSNTALLLEIGDTLLRLGELSLAEKAYTQGLETAPGVDHRVQLLHGLGAVAIKRDDLNASNYHEALKKFLSASQLNPSDPNNSALSYFGACLSEWHIWVYGGHGENNIKAAFGYCADALSLKPDILLEAEINWILGAMWLDGGVKERARTHYEEALRLMKIVAKTSRARPDARSLRSDIKELEAKIRALNSPRKS